LVVNNRLDEEQKRIIKEMSESKDPFYTRGEIAKKIGASKTTVYLYQKKWGLI